MEEIFHEVLDGTTPSLPDTELFAIGVQLVTGHVATSDESVRFGSAFYAIFRELRADPDFCERFNIKKD
jgi:hypothetical protein